MHANMKEIVVSFCEEKRRPVTQAHVHIAHDEDRLVTECFAYGAITVDDIVDVITNCYTNHAEHNLIWDLTQASGSNLHPRELRKLGTISKNFETRRGEIRVAWITQDRMSHTMLVLVRAIMSIKGSPVRYAMFNTRHDARAWVDKSSSN